VLGSSELVAFVTATDADRAAEFYGGVLGLPLIERTPFALVFRASNATLRVALADRVTPAPSTVLGWTVDDIEATIDDLAADGVAFARYDGMDQDERGIWRSLSGARIAWFADPDGNVLSVTQR
jgi:catechol 2,3-dioxygenase-like lactoylglutathione lyase family enzyme